MRRIPIRNASITVAAMLLLIMLVACSGPDRLSEDLTQEAASVTPTATGTRPPDPTQGADATATDEVDATATDESVPEPSATQDGETGEPTATLTEQPVDEPTATDEPPTDQPTEEPTLPPAARFNPDAVSISFEQVGSGFEQPVFVTHAGGDIYVLEKTGTVKRLDGTMVLDIRDRVVQTGVFVYEHEQGMLGLAFHPDFENNRYFYVHYNDVNGDHVYSRFTVGPDGTADRNSEYVLLSYPQPEVNFQGGMLLFGSDGYLYIGTGTGGTAVELQFQAQDLGSIYGKILRIDVDGGDPYSIPPDNPFIGTDGALDEIWAWGLRNPWRFSFDRATGDLYIGGPGQFTEEWIDFLPVGEPAGQNFGWPIYEGTQCWEDWPGECDPAGLRMPVLTYPTYENGNCVVIGGYVHRDPAIPELNGAYFFGDYCSGNVWAGWQDDAGNWHMQHVFQIPGMVSSFGQDGAGGVYITDITGGEILKVTGTPQ